MMDSSSGIILTSADPSHQSILSLQHFSAGPCIKEFSRGVLSSSHFQGPSISDICSYMDTYPTHIVASMTGVTLSTAFETALACHWRVANEGALFGLPDIKVGITPGGSE